MTLKICELFHLQAPPIELTPKVEPGTSLLSGTDSALSTPNLTPDSPAKQKKLAEAIDVLGTSPGTPNVSDIPMTDIQSLSMFYLGTVTVIFL